MPARGQTQEASTAVGGGLAGETGDRHRAAIPTIARWPLDVEDGLAAMPYRDPWVSLVRDSMVAYGEGRTDVAEWSWAPDIVWRIKTNGFDEELVGADAIFAYHRRLARLSGDTYRQRVIAFQSTQGPIVEAFLRSTGRRGQRELDIPTLVVFELAGSRIVTVTEMPGDPPAWKDFWAGG
jgi:ketosteroid isomerase-like protein